MSSAYISAIDGYSWSTPEESPFQKLRNQKIDFNGTVTLFFWSSVKGHVALQTYTGAEKVLTQPVLNTAQGANGFYISFYPSSCTVRTCTQSHSSHFHSAKVDLSGERDQGAIRIYHLMLSTSHLKRINDKIKQILENIPDWIGTGSGPFALQHHSNCAGMVLSILEAGGIITDRVRVNVFSKWALLTGLFVGCFPAIGLHHAFWKSKNISQELTAAKANVDTSIKVMSSAVVKATSTMHTFSQAKTESQQAINNLIEAILKESVYSILDSRSDNYTVVEKGQQFLLISSLAAAGISIASIALAYFSQKLIRETVDPASIETIVKKIQENESK